MYNSKLLSLFQSFDEEDFRSFRQFIISPFFNTNKNLVKLFEIIYKHRDDLSNKNLQKEKVYSKLDTNNKTYNHQMMKNYMSDLSDLVLKYISVKSFEGSFDEKIISIEYLLNKKNYDLAGKLINTELKNINQEKEISEKYFLNKLKFLELYHNFCAYKNDRESLPGILTDIFETTIKLYLISILKCRFDLETLRKKKEIKTVHPLEIALDKFINFRSLLDSDPALEKFKIYYYAYLSRINNEDESLFADLKSLIFKYIDDFKMDEKHNMGTFLLNFIYGGLYKKGKKYNHESFEINNLLLEKNIFTLGDTIEFNEQSFYNISNNALIVKEYDWLKDFLNNNYLKLNEENRINLYNYFYAFIYLYEKKFSKALEYLSKVNYTDDFSKLDIRVINMMIYFEMKDYDMAFRSVESFRHFISKKDLTINPVFEDYFKKFLKYYTGILNATASNKNPDYAIYAEAKQAGPFMYRDWLMEKMEIIFKK